MYTIGLKFQSSICPYSSFITSIISKMTLVPLRSLPQPQSPTYTAKQPAPPRRCRCGALARKTPISCSTSELPPPPKISSTRAQSRARHAARGRAVRFSRNPGCPNIDERRRAASFLQGAALIHWLGCLARYGRSREKYSRLREQLPELESMVQTCS